VATYPPRITLPYRVSRGWREQRILAGDLVTGTHELQIDLDRLDPELRDRAIAVWKRLRLHESAAPEVLGSGILPGDELKDSPDDVFAPSAADPVTSRIGSLPELPQPGPALELIETYERWIERYLDLAGGALAAWIDKYAPESDAAADESPLKPDAWRHEIKWRARDQQVRTCVIDGRKDLALFQRARGAWQMAEAAREQADADSVLAVSGVVGNVVEFDRKPESVAELVSGYEELCERRAEVTRAYVWTKARARAGFDVEMRRWAFEAGSERLQMGVEDGYRMIPVYLTERIASEVPGFYAYLPKDRDGVNWQPRTGPTQAALHWRRAVQAKVDEHCPPGMPPTTAEIVWMRNPPEEMCDTDDSSYWRQVGEALFDRNQVPFEAIVVPEWLGRYTLIAGVISEDFTVPDYFLLQYVLDRTEYHVDGVPEKSHGRTLSDVPIDTGDFEPVVSPGAADDDIPF